jgi:3-oxoacyl-[acyl-carrier-protein] synthase II
MTDAVVITGVGVVSPLAIGARLHFRRLTSGDSAVEAFDDPLYQNYPPMVRARVMEFDRRASISDRMLRKLLSTSSSYALAAAGEAFTDSGVQQSELAGCGIYVGSVSLEANPEAFIPALRQSIDECAEVNLSRFARQGMKLIDPLFLVRSLPNAGLCGVGIQYQVLGPNANITNGQVSGLEAIFAAVEAIRRGEADAALAGGYDTLLQMDCIVEHLLAGRLAQRNGNPQHACRPFDRNWGI